MCVRIQLIYIAPAGCCQLIFYRSLAYRRSCFTHQPYQPDSVFDRPSPHVSPYRSVHSRLVSDRRAYPVTGANISNSLAQTTTTSCYRSSRSASKHSCSHDLIQTCSSGRGPGNDGIYCLDNIKNLLMIMMMCLSLWFEC